MSGSRFWLSHDLTLSGALKYFCELASDLLLPGALVAAACLTAAYITVATNSGWLTYLVLATGVYTVLHFGHLRLCHKDKVDRS